MVEGPKREARAIHRGPLSTKGSSLARFLKANHQCQCDIWEEEPI